MSATSFENVRIITRPAAITSVRCTAVQHPRVLIVEDDASIRNLVSIALRACGVATHQAKDGEEAIRLLRELRYDLVLLDLMMPNTSGYGVVSAIAEGAVPRPLAVMVASAGDFDRERLPHDVVHVLVSKPFEVLNLCELVRGFLSALDEASAVMPQEARLARPAE